MGGEGGGTRPGLRPASGGLAFLPMPPAPAPVESGALTKPRPDLADLEWPSGTFLFHLQYRQTPLSPGEKRAAQENPVKCVRLRPKPLAAPRGPRS